MEETRTKDPAPAPVSSSFHYYAAMALVVAGIIPRMAEYVRGRNLWSDEAILAAHILHDSWAALMQPFGDSMAPPLFLIGTKAAISLFGTHEQAARLIPFLSGVLLLPAVFWTTRRLFGPTPALVALGLAACCGPLITYSNELRPYASDAVVIVFALGAAWGLPTRDKAGAWLGFGVFAAIAGWFSFPGVIVLAALLGGCALRLRSKRDGALWLCAALPFAISTALLYLAVLRPARADSVTMDLMKDYYDYAGAFMPMAPGPWLTWASFALPRWLDVPLGLHSARLGWLSDGLALCILSAAAGVALWKRPRALAFLLLAPAAALAASALELYPFYGRTVLWTAPLAFATMGCGLLLTARFPRYVVYAALALVMALPGARATRGLIEPSRHHDLRQAIGYMEEHWSENDRLYMPPAEATIYAFMVPVVSPDRILESVPPADDSGPVWFAFTYDTDAQRESIRSSVFPRREPTIAYTDAPGAAVYRYDAANTMP